MLEQYHKLFPKKFKKYIEPFVGGGAVLFDLQPAKAVISDLNKDLMDVYAVAKNNPEELIKLLQKHKAKHNNAYYYKIRSQYNKGIKNKTEKAAIFIYLNKTCFNGLYRVNSKGEFNVPIGKKSVTSFEPDNLRAISKQLKNVTLKNEPFDKVLSYAERGDFVYLDPPYYPLNGGTNFTSYTKEAFLKDEQKKLAGVFRALDKKGCKVMLSNSDSEFIEGLYYDYNIVRAQARRMINCDATKRGLISELVIRNYF